MSLRFARSPVIPKMTIAHGSGFASWRMGLPAIVSAAITLWGGSVSMGSCLGSVVLDQAGGGGAIDEPRHLAGEGVDELRRVAERVARTLEHLGQHVRFGRT